MTSQKHTDDGSKKKLLQQGKETVFSTWKKEDGGASRMQERHSKKLQQRLYQLQEAVVQ